MDSIRLGHIGKGLALSIVYCIAYLSLWYLSFNQWFLPAGLRIACLLFLPYRYWPYILLGDISALLYKRIPMAETYSTLWAYTSPFVLGPMTAVLIVLFRRKLANFRQISKWLPIIGIAASIWGALTNLLANQLLSGPDSLSAPIRLVYLSLGYYQGILLICLPCLIWLLCSREKFFTRQFTRDLAIAIGIVLSIYCFVVFNPTLDPSIRQSLLILMIVPVAGLTFLHAWRGAAIGTIIVNIATAQTLTYTGKPNASDDSVFVAQLALAIIATALLVLGTMISESYEKARKLGVSERKAIELSKSSFLSNERNLRDKVVYLAQMQICLDDNRKQLVELLKEHKQYTAAMLLNSEAVEHTQWFESQAAALYPLKIEERGLYGAIYPDNFTQLWAGNAEVNYVLRGRPSTVTTELQLAAYRCLCNAFALLSECAPKEYQVKLRVWQRRDIRGISMRMIATPTTSPRSNQASVLAEAELEGRTKAYGGFVRRKDAYRIDFLLSESISVASMEEQPRPDASRRSFL